MVLLQHILGVVTEQESCCCVCQGLEQQSLVQLLKQEES